MRDNNYKKVILSGNIIMSNITFDDVLGTIIERFPDYVIYENGEVYSLLMNKYISFHERNGYRYTRLTKGEKRPSISQHRLVALAFIPNPENLLVVGHKDGNGLNNDIDNLKWCTRKDIIQHSHDTGLISNVGRPIIQYTPDGKFVAKFESIYKAAQAVECSTSNIGQICNQRKGKKTAKGYTWRFETEKDPFSIEENEEWREIQEISGYKISSKGRVYSTKTKRYISLVDRKDEYVRVCIAKKQYYVHKLMTVSFFGPPPSNFLNPTVNHKDGDKSNNVIENLEWVEFNGNILHAHQTGLNSTGKPVIRYSLKGVQLSTYKNSADAARDVGVSHTSVIDACKKKEHVHTIADSIWRFASDPLSVRELDNVCRLKSNVIQYSIDGQKLNTFFSIREAAKSVNIHPSSITHACRGKTKTSGGFVWRYEDDAPPREKVKCGVIRRVEQLSLKDEPIKVWDSISDASRELKIGNSHITSVCKGNRKSTGGFSWRYIQ